MKRIDVQELFNFNGVALTLNDKTLTTKDVIVALLGNFNSKNGTDNIRAYKIGIKLFEHPKDDTELEDADYDFIIDVLHNHNNIFTAIAIGQVLDILNKANPKKDI